MDTKEFCRKLAKGLEKDGWGDMEPYVFENIAAGFTGKEDPTEAANAGLLFDKIDAKEMLDCVASMKIILDGIFTTKKENSK